MNLLLPMTSIKIKNLESKIKELEMILEVEIERAHEYRLGLVSVAKQLKPFGQVLDPTVKEIQEILALPKTPTAEKLEKLHKNYNDSVDCLISIGSMCQPHVQSAEEMIKRITMRVDKELKNQLENN